MMIFSLVAMTGLEKCCITSAYLQWLCHSGERPMASGPLVSLCIYTENFKNLNVRKHWTDFYITRQKCFLGDIVQAIMICQKNIAARGRGLISLYIYIENFKNLLVRNHWTDFINTWQKSFLGDSLPRLFKLS